MRREEYTSVTIDATTGKPEPLPPKIKLSNIEDVRREMATIYREVRAGKMDVGDVGRLAYVLTGIGKLAVQFDKAIRCDFPTAKRGSEPATVPRRAFLFSRNYRGQLGQKNHS